MKKLIMPIILAIASTFSSAEIRLVTLDYPPYIEATESGLDGVAVILVKDILSQLERTNSIELLPWGRSLARIEKGEADAIFTAFKTPEREAFADYGNEVLFDQNINIISSKSSEVEWDSDRVSDYSICVLLNVSYGQWMDDLISSEAFKAIYKVRSPEQCLLMLISNRTTFWVSNELGARYSAAKMKKTNEITIVYPPVASTPSYIAFSKLSNLSDLRDSFDKTLMQMKSDGRYQKLIDKYFAELEKNN